MAYTTSLIVTINAYQYQPNTKTDILGLVVKMTDLDKWIDIVKECKYLPENDLKKLCEIVSDLLLEESNIQPVSTPVTVCGDIHGQVTSNPCIYNVINFN